MSKSVLSKLETAQGFLGSMGCCDVATSADRIANLLGLQGICVSDARVDLGTVVTPSVQNIVGDSILLYRRDDALRRTDGPYSTFAFQANYMPNGQIFEVQRLSGLENTWNMGARGGVRIRVTYSSKYVYNFELGRLITNVCV